MAPFPFFHFLCFLMPCSSSSTYISNNIFGFRGFTGRTLLQQIEACPVDFAHKNYTALSNNCKEPNYSAEQCCLAFKKLTCPYWNQLSDPKYDCAPILFSYINLYSKHPPDGLSDLCHESDQGLDCGPILNGSAPSAPRKSGAQRKCTRPLMLMITAGLLRLVFHLF
ncbi:hypothetical protein LguiA_022547 [Lonicera macranthoides]